MPNVPYALISSDFRKSDREIFNLSSEQTQSIGWEHVRPLFIRQNMTDFCFTTSI